MVNVIYGILTLMPVLSTHSRQDCNPVLHGDYKNVCLEGVTLYHTDDNPKSAVKRGLLYQCDLTSSNQSISFPVFLSPPPLQKDRKLVLGKSGLSNEPHLSLCMEQHRAKELPLSATSPWTIHHKLASHSFVFRVSQISSKLPQLPGGVSMTKGPSSASCLFSFCLGQLQSHL